MVQIPENEVTQADLNAWSRLQEELRKIRASELLLRQKIFKGMFKDPKEGTNTVNLSEGWVLKGGYVINRDIDQGALAAYKEPFVTAGIHVDELVVYKPSLVMKEYRTLTEEQRKLFDNALIIKPGSPTLEIVLPAKNRKAQ